LSEFLATGRAVDVILAFMALEALVLAVYRRRSGRGIPLGDLVVSLAGGVFLLLALRGALTGADWTGIVPWLALSGVAHVADLARRGRWRA
jgi:hypothetical protein